FHSFPTATSVIYPLSLHDALPIFEVCSPRLQDSFGLLGCFAEEMPACPAMPGFSHRFQVSVARRPVSGVSNTGFRAQEIDILPGDRKSTRLNSSHDQISYAVFCLK